MASQGFFWLYGFIRDGKIFKELTLYRYSRALLRKMTMISYILLTLWKRIARKKPKDHQRNDGKFQSTSYSF